MIYPTLFHVYSNSIDTYSDRPAFSLYEGETVTYGIFAQRVESVQSFLLSAGLQKGDKVALLSTNMPNWNVCYFAAVSLGMVIVPILPDFSGEAISSILEHSGSKALCVSDKLYAKIPHEAREKMELVIRTVSLTVIGGKKMHAEGVPAE